MMSTEISRQAHEKLTAMIAELDPGLLKRRFDDPIGNVLREFTHQAEPPVTHKVFHQTTSDFIKQIYTQALAAGAELADPLAAALTLLEDHYQSAVYGPGYVAALLDANDTGIEVVLACLAESIKEIEQHKYLQSVCAWHLNGADWNLRCRIAGLLQQKYRPFIPDRLAACPPEQLADQIPALIWQFIGSDAVLEQIAFSAEKTRPA